jgi:peptidoglycan/LPS O-acetylase OafA/YrhL
MHWKRIRRPHFGAGFDSGRTGLRYRSFSVGGTGAGGRAVRQGGSRPGPDAEFSHGKITLFDGIHWIDNRPSRGEGNPNRQGSRPFLPPRVEKAGWKRKGKTAFLSGRRECTVMNLGSPSPAGPQTQPGRLEFVDALRGLGALYIVIFHLVKIPEPDLAVPAWANRIVQSGGTAVTLFFVLSGFALMLSMRGHAGERHPTMSFYFRRAFRILPLFLVWLAVSLIRDRVTFSTSHSGGEILLNALLVFNLVPGLEAGIVWGAWILSVETLFYLIFPLLYRWLDDLGKVLAFLFLSMAVSGSFSYLLSDVVQMDPTVRSGYFQFHILEYIPVFTVGMAVYLLYEKHIRNRNRPWSWGLACAAAGAYVYMACLNGKLFSWMDIVYWQALAYGLLLTGLSMAPLKIAVNPVSRFLGKISYSLYLNHPTFVYYLIPVFLSIYALPAAREIQFGACLLLTLVISLAVSVLTHYLIERPGMRLGGWALEQALWLHDEGWSGIRKRWTRGKTIHGLILGGGLVYLLAAPAVYDRAVMHEGKAISVVRGGYPAISSQVECGPRGLDPVDDQGLYKFRGWAFVRTKENIPSARYQRMLVLSTGEESRYFAASNAWSLDIDTVYKSLGQDLSTTGFEALLYRDGIGLGVYHLGVLVKLKNPAEAYYAPLGMCIQRTVNHLYLKLLNDSDCPPLPGERATQSPLREGTPRAEDLAGELWGARWHPADIRLARTGAGDSG